MRQQPGARAVVECATLRRPCRWAATSAAAPGSISGPLPGSPTCSGVRRRAVGARHARCSSTTSAHHGHGSSPCSTEPSHSGQVLGPGIPVRCRTLRTRRSRQRPGSIRSGVPMWCRQDRTPARCIVGRGRPVGRMQHAPSGTRRSLRRARRASRQPGLQSSPARATRRLRPASATDTRSKARQLEATQTAASRSGRSASRSAPTRTAVVSGSRRARSARRCREQRSLAEHRLPVRPEVALTEWRADHRGRSSTAIEEPVTAHQPRAAHPVTPPRRRRSRRPRQSARCGARDRSTARRTGRRRPVAIPTPGLARVGPRLRPRIDSPARPRRIARVLARRRRPVDAPAEESTASATARFGPPQGTA